MKKISVVLPTKNRSSLLKKTISYLLNQTLNKKDYEIIVIDNGSTDNTKFIVDKYKKTYPNVIKYVFEPKVGRSIAKNKGIILSKGELTIFIDDDLLCEKNLLKLHYESYLMNKGITMGNIKQERHDADVFSKFINSGTFIKTSQQLESLKFFHTTANLSIPSKIAKSNLFDEIFLKYGYEDFELGYRLFKKNIPFNFHQEIIAKHIHKYDLELFLKNKYQAGQNRCILLKKHPDAISYIGNIPDWAYPTKPFIPFVSSILRNIVKIFKHKKIYRLLLGLEYLRGYFDN